MPMYGSSRMDLTVRANKHSSPSADGATASGGHFGGWSSRSLGCAALPGQFHCRTMGPGVGGFNLAEVGSVKGLEGFHACARGS
jgi:hypothetical protein